MKKNLRNIIGSLILVMMAISLPISWVNAQTDICEYDGCLVNYTDPFEQGRCLFENSCGVGKLVITISGSGSVAVSPSMVCTWGTCIFYPNAGSFTLNATPDQGHSFWAWSGCSGSGPSCIVFITNGNTTNVNATFTDNSNDIPPGSGGSDGGDGGSDFSGNLKNYLLVDDLNGLIDLVVNFLTTIAFAAAAFFLLLSGYRFVTAQGNESKIKDAKNTLIFTIIGLLFVIGGRILIEVLKDLLVQFGGGS